MKKVVIVGAKGTIGRVLTEGFAKEFEIVGVDLPDTDARDYDALQKKFTGADVVIHVAHGANEETRENWRSGKIDPDNVLIEMNVIHAALDQHVPRLIVASSVHADDFNGYEGSDVLTVPGSRMPASPYGAHKIVLEEMGRFFASRRMIEFIAVRFGGVTPDNSVRTHLKEPRVWLSHHDLVGALRSCIDAPSVSDDFAVFYAVSDNDDRLHDTSNPFGWKPQDNSKDYM